ncbi:N-acetyltransferase family protein [uncultured Paraglaciecola sp.]|uniref:GNAT family N-acetyltransferase n=1 Tax=uncultured Paraglaciecola sp. TaxID=1765024 RepID=UPI0030D9F00C|tara:strand:- start:43179 stop:43679 length:501 start_codon:yes stop_codon:yes gene_type:complete
MIRAVKYTDASQLADIYNYYVMFGTATFETEAVSADEMANRIQKIEGNSLPWIVAEDQRGSIIGYAYASKWKERHAYRHSVEITVYLDKNHRSQGLGSKLYAALFAHLKSISVHVAIAGIALPNETSIALHEKFAMKKVAHFAEVGNKFGKWVDVGYWQLVLNTMK